MLEKTITKLRAISSVLIYMSYAEDDIQDNAIVFSFLSSQISECVEDLLAMEK